MRKFISTCTSHISVYCERFPFLHTVLLSSCEFREDQLREWRIYVITLNKIKFERVQRKVRNAENKEHLCNACMSWQKVNVLQYYLRMALSIRCKPHNSKAEHSAVWYHRGFLLFMFHINVMVIFPILTAELSKTNFSRFAALGSLPNIIKFSIFKTAKRIYENVLRRIG